MTALTRDIAPVRMAGMGPGAARQSGLVSLLMVGLVTVVSCSGREAGVCEGVKSVSDFVSQFSQGLDNFAEDRYTQLRLDSLDSLDTVRAFFKDATHGREARNLGARLQTFVAEMDKVSWDVSQALESEAAVKAASELGTSDALADANSVEAVLIDTCGLPTTQPPIVGSDSLPFPEVQSPAATDPQTNGPNLMSEDRASGLMVATQFGLTLTDVQVVCLGRALNNAFTDETTVDDPVQTRARYQDAFDGCGIRYSVPKD